MKHLLLLLVLVVSGYAIFQIADPVQRRVAIRAITKHGLRIGAIVLILLLLLWAAAILPSTSLI